MQNLIHSNSNNAFCLASACGYRNREAPEGQLFSSILLPVFRLLAGMYLSFPVQPRGLYVHMHCKYHILNNKLVGILFRDLRSIKFCDILAKFTCRILCRHLIVCLLFIQLNLILSIFRFNYLTSSCKTLKMYITYLCHPIKKNNQSIKRI